MMLVEPRKELTFTMKSRRRFIKCQLRILIAWAKDFFKGTLTREGSPPPKKKIIMGGVFFKLLNWWSNLKNNLKKVIHEGRGQDP